MKRSHTPISTDIFRFDAVRANIHAHLRVDVPKIAYSWAFQRGSNSCC